MKSKLIGLALLSVLALSTLAAPLLAFAPPSSLQPAAQTTTVVYTPTTTLLANPERGWYHHTATGHGEYTPLDLAMLQGYRQNEQITLILRLFDLNDFVTSDISPTYLTAMQADFDTVRQAGLKMIVRFVYTDTPHFAPGTDWPPIPPYGDASKAQMLRHLEQLQPVLQANSDVIAVVQAGFIGIWGEWFYTDDFVQDPTQPDIVTATDYLNRAQVLSATLAALPSSRMVQIRTPRYKVAIIPDSQGYTPITPDQAYNATALARTGYHNDCFLADDTDAGTYVTPTVEYPYLEVETKYLPMGGETCAVNPPRSDCATALEELARFHWSYLNRDYQPDVIAGWQSGGCFDEVQRWLGYRLTLVDGVYANAVRAGAGFSVSLRLRNEGWAAPFNPRPLELWLRHTSTGVTYSQTLPVDPRFWLADAGTTYPVNYTFVTPADMPTGDYELLLKLPDPAPSLAGRAEYAIRLANELVWEEATGFNRLLHTLTVSWFGYLPVIMRN